MKIRIGKSFDKETNEVFYQLQFKLDGERTYNAYSYDFFKEESDAKELIKELETCKPDAVVSIVINEINLEVTELITPAPEIVELS